MSYTPTTWADGDVISATKMNKIEQQLSTLSNNIIFTGEEKLVDGVDVNGKEMYVGMTYSYDNVQYEDHYELLPVYFSDISLENFLNYKYIISDYGGVDYYMVFLSIGQTTIKEGMTYLNSLSELDPGIYYGLSSNCSGIIVDSGDFDGAIILPTTAQIGSRTVVASAGEA